MGLTLNQVVSRIQTVVLNHKQIKSFYFGKASDFLNDKELRYAGCFVTDTGVVIDLAGKVTTYSFKMFLLDLVNVSNNAKENEFEVQSDMMSVAQDLMALFDYSEYTDWRVSQNNPVQLVSEEFADMNGGVAIDFSINVQYLKDVCAVPTV